MISFEHREIQYFSRIDAIGGELYIVIRKIGSRYILCIGDENGEVQIKEVKSDKEVEEFINQLR